MGMKMEELVAAGMSMEEAHILLKVVDDVASRYNGRPEGASEVWREIVARKLLRPDHPHALHQLVYYTLYSHWDSSLLGPPLYWFPSL